MKVLILGRGFLGTNIYTYLNRTVGQIEGSNINIVSKVDLDYTDYSKLSEYIYAEGFHTVVNASGYTGKPNIDAAEREKELCWKLNVEVPITIAEACADRYVRLVHLSSGCIYNGYDKVHTEDDAPNFGMYSDESSFYAKSKHVAEMMLERYSPTMLRIRMPFCGQDIQRNYFNKLLGYDNLINFDNSVTCVEDLCMFIGNLFARGTLPPVGKFNVVNEGTLSAREVVELMSKHGLNNPNHKFIELSELDVKAKRSNTVISSEKIRKLGLVLPHALDSAERCIVQLAGAK
jgi:dTDP-4-dehydrorhamnose reductase